MCGDFSVSKAVCNEMYQTKLTQFFIDFFDTSKRLRFCIENFYPKQLPF